MNNFSLRTGDLIRFKNDPDTTYLVGNRHYAISDKSLRSINDEDILEIRREKGNIGHLLNRMWTMGTILWRAENKYIFEGVSFSADAEDFYNFKNAEGLPVKLYDNSQTLEENNKTIAKAEKYVMIPPRSFNEDHIIGEGLYQQYLVRTKAGKPSYVYTKKLGLRQIKTVYKLQDPRKTHSALVILK